MILDRVEIAIEIVAPALAAADLADRNIPDPSVTASPHIAGVSDFGQGMKTVCMTAQD
jgi:hypothetical protein